MQYCTAIDKDGIDCKSNSRFFLLKFEAFSGRQNKFVNADIQYTVGENINGAHKIRNTFSSLPKNKFSWLFNKGDSESNRKLFYYRLSDLERLTTKSNKKRSYERYQK